MFWIQKHEVKLADMIFFDEVGKTRRNKMQNNYGFSSANAF
jgi:hypothetical protein